MGSLQPLAIFFMRLICFSHSRIMPPEREVYVAYEASIPQDVVDLAFQLSFAQV